MQNRESVSLSGGRNISEERVRVLILDDNPGRRKQTQDVLECVKGCVDITALSRAEEAIRCLQRDDPDVLVVGFQPPDVTVEDFLLTLRDVGVRLPIIVTGNPPARQAQKREEIRDERTVWLGMRFSRLPETIAGLLVEREKDSAEYSGAIAGRVRGLALRVVELQLQMTQTLRLVGERNAELLLCKQMIDSTSDAMILIDATGSIVYGNPAFQQLTGYAPAEIMGLTVPMVTDPWLEASLILRVWRTVRRRRTWAGEMRIPRPKGDDFYAAVNVSPVFDETGSLSHILINLRNITREKDLLARLSVANENLVSANQQLAEMIVRDPLTNLFNRRYLEERMKEEFSRSARSGEDFCCVMLDLDHFKRINDQYGHPYGDRILRWVAGVMKSSTRKEDIVVRYGGEEFAALLPRTDPEQAWRVAERIRSSIEQGVPPEARDGLRVTVSIGIACLTGGRAYSSEEEMLRAADDSLYEAKRSGRNRICFPGRESAGVVRTDADAAVSGTEGISGG